MGGTSTKRCWLVIFVSSLLAWRRDHHDPEAARSPPEASSTLLKMHRLYTRQPPHDSSLYDLLEVSPNATAAEITKSYRKLSRRLHPDKQRRHHHHYHHGDDDDDALSVKNKISASQKLQRVREAYEILKDDATRLPYHRHGLLDSRDAVVLLTGKGRFSDDPPVLRELLRLMGYDNGDDNDAAMLKNTLPPSRQEHERRVWFLAANLVETMRPVVEGALPESFLLDHIIQQCDRLKRLPLGAQILRCIGRAYRYSGKRILRRHHQRKKTSTVLSGLLPVALQDSMRDKLREAKHIATAALAGGRVVLEEHVSPSISKQASNNKVEASRDEDHHQLLLESSVMPDQHVDDFCYQPPSDAEIKETEQRKARAALLQSLQVEALWKICKIDLDRTIREACDLILEGEYFFFPSHYLTQQQQPPNYHSSSDGWIGSSGIAVTADVGRIRAASLLYSMGEIMVKRSKEGTAWME